MKNLFLNKFKSRVHKQCLEIKQKEDKFIFHLKHAILGSKNYLIIKHGETGRRISKPFKSSKCELSISEIEEIGNLGFYDAYIQMHFMKKVYLKRVRFILNNENKYLFDAENGFCFETFQSKYFNLTFYLRKAKIFAKAATLEKKNNSLILTGEIDVPENVTFDTVELLIKLSKNRQYIPCSFEKKENGKFMFKSSEIFFTVNEYDLYKIRDISLRIKENGIIYDDVPIKADKLCSFNELDDKCLDYIENFEVIEPENYVEDICSLVYVNNFSNLSFNIINKNIINRMVKNEKRIFKHFSQRDNKKMAFFESFHGKSYSGQPKYIYEKLLDMGYDKYLNFVWSYNGDLDLPGDPIITDRRSDNYKKFLGDCDYWVTNISFPMLKDNDNTVYLQTTHGTPYKRMGADIETNSKNITKGRVLIESETWNYLLAPNEFSKDVFTRAFEYNGSVISKGYPANDIFYQNMNSKTDKIKKQLNIPKDKKVILYAPTFRDYDVNSKSKHQYNNLLDYQKLYDNLKDDYILIVRLHYKLSKDLELSDELKEFIIDLSDYDDIADLYLISDILLTDYSSAFFDYAHSKKPILFYVPDFEMYYSFRGLYDEVKESLPGPEIYEMDELVANIKDIDNVQKKYSKKYDEFYDKFCKWGHGTASEDVVNIVFGDVKK